MNHPFPAQARNDLGSRANEVLLGQLRPAYWFAAHLHVKFSALVRFDGDAKETRFLALDKCLPKRDFLQLLTIPRPNDGPVDLEYDPTWLAVLVKTHGLAGNAPPPRRSRLPDVFEPPTDADVADADRRARARCAAAGAPDTAPLKIPDDFVARPPPRPDPRNPLREANPQTDAFLDMLGLPHVVTFASGEAVVCGRCGAAPPPPPVTDPNEIDIDDDDDDEPAADPAEIDVGAS